MRHGDHHLMDRARSGGRLWVDGASGEEIQEDGRQLNGDVMQVGW